MLPLWIIDITGKSKRRDAFQRLINEIDHVYIPDEIKEFLKDADKAQKQDETEIVDSNNSNSSLVDFGSDVNEDNPKDSAKKTRKEELEEEEIREAAKKAVIDGDYWYYSVFNSPFETDLTEEEQAKLDQFVAEHNEERGNKGQELLTQDEIDTYVNATKLYRFQEEMVKEGVSFINHLRLSNVKPYQTINIVVLGDATESFTRSVFPSIAALLQKEKGRYWSAHIHQGMKVLGILYVPCDVNTYEVGKRKEILHMLDEIEVQHDITAIRGYDHMMLYQNVQNRTECSYPMLKSKQQADYLVQCLVHMFLATTINHPTISGTSAEDTFYFSMGAASVYFDMKMEDANDTNNVAKNLVDTFKEDGDREDATEVVPLLKKEVYSAEIFVKEFTKMDNMDIEDIEPTPFSPHPIVNYLHKGLKKLYYYTQLRFFPASLLRQILNVIEDKTSNMLDKISATSNSAYKNASVAIHPAIVKRLAKVSQNDGALSHIEFLIRNMQELMSKERDRVRVVLESEFWDRIIYKSSLIPKNQQDFFIDYHETYKNDVASKNDGAGCATSRDEALTKLKSLLSKEKTMLATLGRTFFMCIISVLFFLPILDNISPDVIDLGDVKKNAFYWSVGVFMIPVIIQWIMYLVYMRKKDACIRVLKAYYTHDAYARVANRIETESNEVYLKLINLGEEYLERCRRIRKEVRFVSPLPDEKMTFPKTMFNQPLNGGTFNGDVVIPEKEIECSKLRINFEPRPVNELNRSEYYLLINYFNDILGMLLGDVSITESHAKRYNENTGDYEFVSKDELLRIKEEEWELKKVKFRELLLAGIKKEMLPREYPTVGDKLIQYKKKIESYTLLEPLMSFAATNGELTSLADPEYADIKVNREIDDLSSPYLPYYNTRTQVGKHDEIYKKYIFITRWRCFEHFSYNRLFPTEDFDMDQRAIVNYEQENKVRSKKQKELERQSMGTNYVEEREQEVELPYEPCQSSLILWAVCPDENSSKWLSLFNTDHFGRAFQDREKYREILNQND